MEGTSPPQGTVVLQLSLPLQTPHPRHPRCGCRNAGRCTRMWGEVGRNDSHVRGFVSHRPEFKSRPCWLCDLGDHLWAALSPHRHGWGTSRCGVLGLGGRTPAGAPGLLLHSCPLGEPPPSGGHRPCVEEHRGRESEGQKDPARGQKEGGSEKAVQMGTDATFFPKVEGNRNRYALNTVPGSG